MVSDRQRPQGAGPYVRRYFDNVATQFLAIQCLDGIVSVLLGKVLDESVITLVATNRYVYMEPHPLSCLIWSMSQKATIPPPRRPKSLSSCGDQVYASQRKAESRRTCHRVRLDRFETTIGYLRRALHGANLGEGVKAPLIPKKASGRVYLPRIGGLWGGGDLAVSALSGLPPRVTTASRLGRAYSTMRSGGAS